MRRHWSALALAVALIFPAAQNVKAQEGTLDTLFLMDGSKRLGRITGYDGQYFRLQIPPSQPGQPTITVNEPRERVIQVEFAPDEAREELLRSATTKDAARVSALWRKFEPYLDVPKSPSGEIGNVHADLLLRTGDPARAAEALELFTRIETKSWDEDDRMLARQGRLRAMVATGRAADAIDEARDLARISEDPAVLIEAKYILAAAAGNDLKQLLEDNPRWEEDVRIRPERHRLYNDAIDQYLFPYLFYGSEIESAARGLWGAVEIYQLVNEPQHGVEAARDLIAIYPETRYAKLASEYLAGLPEEITQQDHEKEAKED